MGLRRGAGGDRRDRTPAPDGEGPGPIPGITRGPQPAEKRELARALRARMTPAETRLWQFLRANRLGGLHFRRQQLLFGYVADFYCHAAALVVEVDGAVHADRKDYDAFRDELFAQHGLAVLRVSNDAVLSDIDAVLDRIREAAVRSPRPLRAANSSDGSAPP